MISFHPFAQQLKQTLRKRQLCYHDRCQMPMDRSRYKVLIAYKLAQTPSSLFFAWSLNLWEALADFWQAVTALQSAQNPPHLMRVRIQALSYRRHFFFDSKFLKIISGLVTWRCCLQQKIQAAFHLSSGSDTMLYKISCPTSRQHRPANSKCCRCFFCSPGSLKRSWRSFDLSLCWSPHQFNSLWSDLSSSLRNNRRI